MTYETELSLAREICEDYINNGAEQEFTSRSDEQRYCGRVSSAASTLMDSDKPRLQKLGEWIYETAPGLWDYDEKGNFIGAVANEDGWTA